MLRRLQELYRQVLKLRQKFLVAVTRTDQEQRIPGLYKIRLRYRLRMFWIRDVKQAFCTHTGKTYVDAYWTWTLRKCSNCHKVLRDLRKDPE